MLEDLEITVADYVQRAMKANFAAAWEEIGEHGDLLVHICAGVMENFVPSFPGE